MSCTKLCPSFTLEYPSMQHTCNWDLFADNDSFTDSVDFKPHKMIRVKSKDYNDDISKKSKIFVFHRSKLVHQYN